MRTSLGIMTFFAAASFAFMGCTRSAPETSKITVKMPALSGNASQKIVAQAMGVGAFASTTKWGLPIPGLTSDLNCFAIGVAAPDLSENIQCEVNQAGFRGIHALEGVFTRSSEQSIEVQSGKERTIFLVGMKTTDPSLCVSLGEYGGVLPAEKFSPPVVIAQVTMDLQAGPVVVPMQLSANVGGDVVEDCNEKPFATNPIEANILSGLSPYVNASGTSLVVDIGGFRVDRYLHEIVPGLTCAGVVYDQPSVQLSTVDIVEDISGLADGYYTLCVLGKYFNGVNQSVATSYTFLKDTGIPANAVVSVPQFGNTPTPTVMVIGAGPGESVQLYRDAACTIAEGAPVAETGSFVTITTSNLGTDGSYLFKARITDQAGNVGPCNLSATYTLDRVGPVFTGLTDKDATSLYYSPLYSWNPATDASSGLDYYSAAVGTSAGAADLVAFTGTGTNLSFMGYIPGLFSNAQTYHFSVRAYDKAGNYTELRDPWKALVTTPLYQQQTYFKAGNNQSGENQTYGWAVDIDGEFMVVGAPFESSDQMGPTSGTGTSTSWQSSTDKSGAAYVYKRSGTAWTQVAYLKAADPQKDDQFGYSVAISGRLIAIGANNEESTAAGVFMGTTESGTDDSIFSGAVYVFKGNADGTDWQQEAYIKPPVAPSNTHIYFGHAVALHGDVLAVSALNDYSSLTGPRRSASFGIGASTAGAVHVYRRGTSTWNYVQYLKPPVNSTNLKYGNSVDVYDDMVVVGAPNDSTPISGAGAVHAYRFDGILDYVAMPGSPMKASNAQIGDMLGTTVRIFKDRIVAGAPEEDGNTDGVNPADNNLGVAAGAAYVFKFDTAWTQEAYIKPNNSETGDKFGTSVDIHGSTILVGAPYEQGCGGSIRYDNNPETQSSCLEGAVYVYRLNSAATPLWVPAMYLKPGNISAGHTQGYGQAVALSGSSILIGAFAEDSAIAGPTNAVTWGTDSGSAGAGAAWLYEFLPGQ